MTFSFILLLLQFVVTQVVNIEIIYLTISSKYWVRIHRKPLYISI